MSDGAAEGAHEVRLRRVRMRSWRRGTKEMDLILGPYADERLGGMDDDALALYEALLAEGDTDLYGWIAGREAPPERYGGLVGAIREATRRRHG